MKNTDVRPPVLILVLAVSITVFTMSGCARGPEANANINTNINTNTSLTNTNTNVNAAPPSTLAAREPDTYRAMLVFTAETEGGEKTVGIPPLSAEVARNGADRRVSFKLPDGSDLVYLDQDRKSVV